MLSILGMVSGELCYHPFPTIYYVSNLLLTESIFNRNFYIIVDYIFYQNSSNILFQLSLVVTVPSSSVMIKIKEIVSNIVVFVFVNIYSIFCLLLSTCHQHQRDVIYLLPPLISNPPLQCDILDILILLHIQGDIHLW